MFAPPVPPVPVQKELIAQVEAFGAEIERHSKIMNEAKDKKENIIKKYLSIE